MMKRIKISFFRTVSLGIAYTIKWSRFIFYNFFVPAPLTLFVPLVDTLDIRWILMDKQSKIYILYSNSESEERT